MFDPCPKAIRARIDGLLGVLWIADPDEPEAARIWGEVRRLADILEANAPWQ